jgi:hypothetical protein
MALSRFVLPYADVGAGIRPSSGAKLFFYASGTSTFKSTFTDATGSTANTNPVIANANGVFPAIFLDGVFNVALKDSNDVQIYTADPVYSGSFTSPVFSTVAAMVASSPAAIDGFIVEFTVGMFVSVVDYATGNDSGVLFGSIVAGGTGTADGGSYIDLANGMQWKQNFPSLITVKMFGAVGDGVVNDTIKIQAAIDAVAAIIGNASAYDGSGYSVFFPNGTYLVTTITMSNIDGVALVGDGSRGAVIESSHASSAMIVLGDATHALNTYGIQFKHLHFRNTSDTTTSVGIDGYSSFRCMWSNCTFQGFSQAFISNRCTRTSFSDCTFLQTNTVRTTRATAFITLKGTTASNTGGGVHIDNCEFLGSGTLNQGAGILVQTVDGLYISNTHFNGCERSIDIEPTGTEALNKITDIYVSNCYFDAENCINNVSIRGTVNSGGFYQNIRFDNCFFRGGASGEAVRNVHINVADGGTFNGRVENIGFVSCQFKQADKTAILVEGDSSYLEVYGLTIQSSYFSENNQDGTQSQTDINVESESVSIIGNYFDPANNIGSGCINLSLSNPQSGTPSAVVSDNNFSFSQCTGDAIAYSSVQNTALSITDNVQPGPGQSIRQIYKTTTTSDTSAIAWRYSPPSAGQSGIINVRTVSSNSAGSAVVMDDRRASYVLSSGSTTTLIDPATSETYNNLSSNSAPVALIKLTGSAWAATTAYSAEDVVTNGGNVYLVITAGTTASAAPTNTSGRVTDGSLILAYVSAIASSDIALVVSGSSGVSIDWAVEVNMLSVS